MRTADGGWTPHRSFRARPTIDFGDPQAQFLDLNGDGFADLVRTEQQALTWFPSLGRDGFAALRRNWMASNELDGPNMLYSLLCTYASCEAGWRSRACTDWDR